MGDPRPPLQPTAPLDSAAQGGLTLLIWEPGGATRQLQLSPGVLTIGRAGSEADVAVDDAAVSRLHASLFIDEVVELKDEGSSNGTFVAGQRLPPNRHVTLGLEEPVVLGATTLFLRRGPAPAAADTPRSVFVPPEVRPLVDKIVGLRWTVLIIGETGTGKHRLAKELHERSKMPGALVELDCRGSNEEELRAALVGGDGEPSAFERAKEGTLVIREITKMPLGVQDTLIRELDRVAGDKRGATKHVRIVATSRVGPAEALRLGVFKKELRYRLGAVNVVLSPLRERPDCLPAIADAMLAEVVAEQAMGPRTWSAEAETWFGAQAWAGNLRELASVIRTAAIGSTGPTLTPDDLKPWSPDPVPEADAERERIVAALASCAGNQSAAAKLLGISRGTLVSRIRQYGLARPRKR